MDASELIHWHEGLFLRPHHLQVMQQSVCGMLRGERELAFSYPYGVIESELVEGALENMVVRFSRLRAVMPDGLVVDVPRNTPLPPLNMEEAMSEATGPLLIYLAVPVWYEGRGNVVAQEKQNQSKIKRRFQVDEIEWADENTGENPQPIPVRRINARLVLETDDHTDLDVMPILKLRRASGEEAGRLERDPGFTPPSLVVRGSHQLQEMALDLAHQVEASRKAVSEKVGAVGADAVDTGGGRLELLLRLRTLNKYSGRLREIARAPRLTPFALYLELQALLGELSALTPESGELEIGGYDHENLLPPFQDLAEAIRSLLRGGAEKFLKVPFVPEEGVRVAHLEAAHFEQASAYYLGIETDQDPSSVEELVEDRAKFKIMPASLSDRAIFGFEVDRVHFTPAQLPSRPGLTYFRLRQGANTDLWEMVVEEGSLAVRWPGQETSNFDVALYMPLSEGEG